MTVFPDLHTVVMFGGQTPNTTYGDPIDTNGMWYLDHTHWIRIHTKASPPPMGSPPPTHNASFVYDTAHHFALLRATGTWRLSP